MAQSCHKYGNPVPHPGDLLETLAPGVKGYTIEEEGVLYIPLIIADQPGRGFVSAYLDSLPKNKTIKFPNVVSGRLFTMLERRGFTLVLEYAEELHDYCPVMVREKEKA